ncbi:ABC transporter G family member 37 [Hordeum vulgare]|nr:ABC transporter G family member 37 [Hordeum vulgare]
MRSCKVRTRQKRVVFLKIGVQKAYDSVSWAFLWEVLLRKGFDDQRVTRVMHIVSCGRSVANINGETGPYFCTLCGFRQGDPFSPFSFNIVVDALATILDKAKAASHIHRVVTHLVGGGISLLHYADDIIIMVEGCEDDIINLKFPVLYFQQISGLKINFEKSEVMILGYSPNEAQIIDDRLNCKLGYFYSLHETLHHEITNY